MTVVLQVVGGGTPKTIVVALRSDLLISDVTGGTHKVTYNGLLVDAKAVAITAFTQSDAHGVSIDDDDSLRGGGDNDTPHSYGGNDILDGGTGNDRLDAGSDIDTLIGGAGSNMFDPGRQL